MDKKWVTEIFGTLAGFGIYIGIVLIILKSYALITTSWHLVIFPIWIVPVTYIVLLIIYAWRKDK